MSAHENQPDPMDNVVDYGSAAEYRAAREDLGAHVRTVGGKLIRSKSGDAKPLFDNVVRVLELDRRFKAHLRYNTLAAAIEWRRGETWAEVDEINEGEVISTIERSYEFAASTHAMRALLTVSNREQYNPVRDYLEALTWDGVPRIDEWLSTYYACEAGLDPLLTRKGVCFLVSAVKRAYEPGCKVDAMLTIRGLQGGGKSTGILALAGREYFSDTDIALGHHQDKYQALDGVWIYEIAEGASLNKSEARTIKSFTTSACDAYRGSYGRSKKKRPRQVVFVITTNDQEFLRDTTGNRRYHVVESGGAIDVEGIARDRDQIWAEAVARYREGYQHWFTAEENAHLEDQNDRYLSIDPWAPAIARWVHSRRAPFQLGMILDMLEIDPAHQTRQASNRARDVCEWLGCTKGAKTRRRYCEISRELLGNKPLVEWLPPGFQQDQGVI